MYEIQLTSSVAQATEIMSALIANRTRDWIDTRSGMGDFYSTWGMCGDEETGPFFLKRIAAFARTLKKTRITKIVPHPVQQHKQHDGDESDFDSLMERAVQFHLGTEKEPSQVVVEVVLQHEEQVEGSFSASHDPWGAWDPSYLRAVMCVKHPNKEYWNYVVLGTDALEG